MNEILHIAAISTITQVFMYFLYAIYRKLRNKKAGFPYFDKAPPPPKKRTVLRTPHGGRIVL